MKNFHDFYFGMPAAAREDYCRRVGTTVKYAERLAGGWRLPSMGLAKHLVQESGGDLTYSGLLVSYEQRNGPL